MIRFFNILSNGLKLNLYFLDFYFLKRQKKSIIKLELILIFIC